MAKKSKTELTPKGFETLHYELKRTTGFSLSGDMHSDIKEVLEDLNMDSVEKLFNKHDKVLQALQVSTLEDLSKL